MRSVAVSIAAGLAGLVSVSASVAAQATALRLPQEARSLDASNGTAGCASACASLRSSFPGQVAGPSDAAFHVEQNHFWSAQQSQTSPACFFLPASAADVAAAVNISRTTKCPFAAKSGGHAAFAGSSNIAGGITIDFSSLNALSVNSGRGTVTLGPGNTWYDAYSQLQQHDLVVIGGRVAAIGVGGLTLGGGISFFSNEHGWALDNVRSYEVVTAHGTVVNASATSHSDLYWALRGGGNNFGLVAAFELDAYPLPNGSLWGGTLMHRGAQNASLFAALAEYGEHGAVADPKTALIVSVYYDQAHDAYSCVSQVERAGTVANGTHPAVFDAFFSEPNRLLNTVKQSTLPDIALDFNSSNPGGLRESYWVATVQLDTALLEDLLAEWVDAIAPLTKTVKGYVPVYSLELVPTPVLRAMARNGGNALGLTDPSKPLVMINPSAMWTDPADDDAVMGVYTSWLAKAKAIAQKRGLWSDYVYMNYASSVQDPISSYGSANVARLKQIAKNYDPDGVFQKLQPGYFKL